MRRQLLLLLMLGVAAQAFAHATYTGRSGAPTRTTCATSCHGNDGGTVTITGFPASYVAGQTYTLTISQSGGDPIANFNASCRIVASNANAGVIGAGTGTSVYNVTGETNGVHFTSVDQNSGTFTWVAPAAGSGQVRLYAGAFQGQVFDMGFNTIISLTAEEGVAAPPTAPAGLVILPGALPNYVTLAWNRSAGAARYNVYRDLLPAVGLLPGNLVATTTDTLFTDSSALSRSPMSSFYAVTASQP